MYFGTVQDLASLSTELSTEMLLFHFPQPPWSPRSTPARAAHCSVPPASLLRMYTGTVALPAKNGSVVRNWDWSDRGGTDGHCGPASERMLLAYKERRLRSPPFAEHSLAVFSDVSAPFGHTHPHRPALPSTYLTVSKAPYTYSSTARHKQGRPLGAGSLSPSTPLHPPPSAGAQHKTAHSAAVFPGAHPRPPERPGLPTKLAAACSVVPSCTVCHCRNCEITH